MLYFLRLVVIYAYFIFFLMLANIIALFRPFHPNNTHIILKWFKPAFWLGKIRIDCIGEVPEHPTPAIYLCNHQDLLDIFYFSQVWPKRTVIIGKRALLFFPLFGTAFWLAGNLFINRSNKKQAWGLMEQVAHALHTKNLNVAFMPEGTRSRGKGLLPFKLGAFAVAIKAQVDIIPICASSTHLIDCGKLTPKPGKVMYLPPISTKGMTPDDAEALAQKCHDEMKAAIAAMDASI
ncbi:MAG: 1-acylglycerol-3-phosphate O-acyltransferase [Cellvibrionales bacterium]|nr:1-acylglycerol-3-phosphate O-acyltransferase [Cellvibrionales bacterium]